MDIPSWRAICFALVCACSQQTASAEQPPAVSSEPSSRTLEAKPANPGLAPNDVADEQEKEEDPAELLRGYGIVDMRFNNCVTRENDQTVFGRFSHLRALRFRTSRFGDRRFLRDQAE
jgi:hypothetical protein